jgi:hypothetical protein
MANSSASNLTEQSVELFWPQLKQAIATSSGFKRWVAERGVDRQEADSSADALVMSYLRQTLETLAY